MKRKVLRGYWPETARNGDALAWLRQRTKSAYVVVLGGARRYGRKQSSLAGSRCEFQKADSYLQSAALHPYSFGAGTFSLTIVFSIELSDTSALSITMLV